ncbi:MAG: OmpA family protein [Bacteroidota bacterium]
MNMNKAIFTLLLITFSVGSVVAQSAKLKRAQQYMDDLNYTEAIVLYNQILEKNDNPDAKINIADCYRKVGDAENAEYWYGQVVQSADAEPIHKLFYGQMLQRNGKCDLAKEWYEAYVEEVPDDLRGQYLVKACDYEEELMSKNAGIFEIKHLDFNSNLDDFGPTYFKDGLVFASERDKGTAIKRVHSWTGNPFLELYYIDAKPAGEECGVFEFGRPTKFAEQLNSKFHDAAVAFSDDEKQIFFTRNNIVKGKTGKSDDGTVKLKVFTAESAGEDNWNNIESLPFNSDEYSVAHPTLTQDGDRLFFASDMPGGFGGMDLYVSERESGRWGPPLNLGPSINTEGNEVFPFYHKDGRLYFSSDGHIGLGGLDIYQMEDKGEGEWGDIENLGYPINSISDDFSVIFDEAGTCGFFASDREGGAGRDDIYSFRKTASPVNVFVYDEETGEPIPGATVVDDCTGATMTTGEDGKVIVDMKMDQCCNFAASKEAYLDNEKEGCTKDVPIGEPVYVEIPLSKELSFDIEGVVFDETTGLPIEGATVTLTSDCGKEPQSLVTDNTGSYYFKLDKECCYVVRGEATDYLADEAKDQCTRGITETMTLQVNLNLKPTKVTPELIESMANEDPQGNETDPTDMAGVDNADSPIYRDPVTGMYIDRETNQPANIVVDGVTYDKGKKVTEEGVAALEEDDKSFEIGPSTANGNVETGESVAYLLHIYYDFDQSYLRAEAEPELTNLKEMLEMNPDVIVEIGSHTDSRGSYSYNRRLSQRRAESVVRWLTTNGIERNRLVPVGYGESRNVNDCKNNIPCSEQEHQLNRRTEFRILGSKGEYDVRKVSQPKANPRVDACEGCPF